MLQLISDSPRRGARDRRSADPSVLGRITRRGVDLCLWERTLAPDLAAWLDAVVERTRVAFEERGTRLERRPWERAVAPLPPHPCRDRLEDDLEGLTRRYVDLLGDVPLRVQLSTIDSRKCPRFHVDAVGVRLLCTYAGAGTEWLEESALDRERLRTCPADEAPVMPGGRVRQSGRFDVTVMKGTAWPGNARFGAVHRSPAVVGPPRLVFTLDASR